MSTIQRIVGRKEDVETEDFSERSEKVRQGFELHTTRFTRITGVRIKRCMNPVDYVKATPDMIGKWQQKGHLLLIVTVKGEVWIRNGGKVHRGFLERMAPHGVMHIDYIEKISENKLNAEDLLARFRDYECALS